jgi:ABC-type polysaccharide/polyol phosphate export permease
VYPLPETGEWTAGVLAANPMSSYLDAYREALLLGRGPSADLLLTGGIGALLSFSLGAVVFQRCAPRFAEEV